MKIELRPYTEKEYQQFFQGYVADPLMEPMPFVYNRESVSRSYQYNYFHRDHYAHFGIFNEQQEPLGCFQLKRMDEEKRRCEFGIILQNDKVKDQGIGTLAILQGMEIARTRYNMTRIMGDTSSRNLRMKHIFEKLGFRLIETVPNAFLLDYNLPGDRLIYEKDLTGENADAVSRSGPS